MKEIKILLSGASGRLGKAIRTVAADFGCIVAAGVDISPESDTFPIYGSFEEVPESSAFDCIIDCSHHTAVKPLLEYACRRKIPTVICTTGHTEEETAFIHKSAETIPVFYSRNMSVGINLIIELAKKAAALLGGNFDIEIIEKHHNKKLDAPSGTALMIADAIRDSRDCDSRYVYERQSRREARAPEEIGIHSVRGGNIVGEHEVIFAGQDEIVTISHHAASREVFAAGAVRAARFTAEKPAGFYDMTDLVNG